MKLHSCHYCDSSEISELGAYVKLSNKLWAHLGCYTNEIQNIGIKMGREAMLTEQAQVIADKFQAAFNDAKRQYEAAIRCLKCGVPMLSERPQALPAAFTTTTPSPSTAATCSPCVRREADLRNAVRQAPVVPATASLMQPKTPASQETSTLIPGGRPIEID